MKNSLLTLLTVIVMSAALPKAGAQAPMTKSGRPVDPKAIENLNQINDGRVKRGLKPLDAPGYTYVPADKRAAAPVTAAPATPDRKSVV